MLQDKANAISTNNKSLSFVDTTSKTIKDNAETREIDELADLQEKFKNILMRSSIEDGEDSLIYGINAHIIKDFSKTKIKSGIIYCNDELSLQFLNPKSKKTPVVFKIPLTSINDMSLGKGDPNTQLLSLPIQEDCFLTIHYSANLKHHVLIFRNSAEIELFITGVISILLRKAKEGNNYDTDLLSLKRIWKEYDPQHSKYLNLVQFSNFLKNISFDYKNKNSEQIFKEIDKKNEGKIRFKDFISFYELLVTGEEFKEVFQKYACQPFKSFLTIKGLVDFMEKEQHETMTQEEALKLVCKYSKKAKKLESKGLNGLKYLKSIKLPSGQLNNTESMLAEYENYSFGKGNDPNVEIPAANVENAMKNAFQLSFREFVNLIIDQQNNTYDHSQMTIHQNMNFPLTDYFCHSSHNTYLTGNQMTSESSIEMYSYVLKNGCRFVDLDTFDGREGDKNEPIITHWHFPVSNVSFKEVLINIKDQAFIKSEFPVILSLENHCSAGTQERMEQYFLDILGRDNIFIIDSENPPLIYPSPNELKRKFIIKNKRKRIFGNLTEMKINYHKFFDSIMSNNKQRSESIKSMDNHTALDNMTIGEGNSMNNNSSRITINHNNTNNLCKEENNKTIVVPVIVPKEKNKDPKDNNEEDNPLEDKKTKIFNRIKAKEAIEEECQSLKSMDSDIDEGKVEISSSKILGKEESAFRLINSIPSHSNLYNYYEKSNTYDDFTISSNLNNITFFPSKNNPQIDNVSNYIMDGGKTTDSSSQRKKPRKKSLSKANTEASLTGHPTHSKNALKNVNDRYTYALYEADADYMKKNETIQRIEEIQINDDKAHHVHIITVDRLANILGMVGVKYHKETFDPTKFLPWECISVSESDVLKYTASSLENKCKIVKYCQKSFLKIYPDGVRTNSSNHNPIICWSLGCQFAALNLQTTNDDWVLINKIFFKINGGSKCGYVLKPPALRELNMDNYRKWTLKPCFKVKLKLLSGFHLHLCCPPKEKITGMFLEISIKSPSNGIDNNTKDYNETKLVTNLISNNFLHPVWQSNSVIFDIYEPELSFILVKLYSKKKEHILARGVIPVKAMSFGYRVLELYDDLCSKLDESYLIVKTNKILL